MESRKGDAKALTREDFKKDFKEKYYPQSFYDAKGNEFLRLVQGLMSAVEYEKRYKELAKYAMTIIANETDRCK